MFPISPLYANRQYAASVGLYKVHAAAKSAQLSRRSGVPLQDAFTTFQQFLRPHEPRKDIADKRESSDRDEVPGQDRVQESADEAQADGTAAGGSAAIPFGLRRNSRPFSPYGRFRGLGFDLGMPPPRQIDPERQAPLARRYAAMLSAYKPAARPGGMVNYGL